MSTIFAGGGGSIPEPTYAGATVRDANGRLWVRGDSGPRWSTDDPPWVADLRWGPLVRAFGPIREELGLLAAILIGAAVLVAKRGLLDLEVKLWLSILMLQAIPYLAAVLCQIIAYLPDNAPPEEQAAKPAVPSVAETPAGVSGTMAH